MVSSGKRISPVWSFVGGTMLGAMAVLGLTGSILGGRPPSSRSGVAASSGVRPTSDVSIPADSQPPAPNEEWLAGHPELELQLD